MGNIVPEYIQQLITVLSEYYTVEYYIEQCGNNITDCFILNSFCIKYDRIPEIKHQLSQANLRILVNSVHDTYMVLTDYAKELGWNINAL